MMLAWKTWPPKLQMIAVTSVGWTIALVILLPALRSPGEMVNLVEVNADLAAGTALSKSQVQISAYPKRYAPPQAISARDVDLIFGKQLQSRLEHHSVLRWNDLADSSEDLHHLAAQVPPGHRALALPHLQEGALQKWLRTGDLIDIVGNFTVGTRRVTRTLFQGVKVLATRPHLILLVTPEQAELLLFAKQHGDLFASLRNRDDAKQVAGLPEYEFSRFLEAPLAGATASTGAKPQVLHFSRTAAK